MTATKKSQVFRFCTTLFFLFCLGIVFFRASPARAARILEEGVSGTCSWKYEVIDNKIVFTLYPTTGEEGTLEDWAKDSASADVPVGMKEHQLYFPSWFENYREDTARIVVKGKVKARTCQAMFFGFRRAVSADLSGLDVTGVKSMRAMFQGCLRLVALDVGTWNVFSVQDMKSMFYGCKSLTSLDVSEWNVSSVTSMRHMFGGCSSLASLDVSRWNVSSVTDMTGMFAHCTSLTALNLGTWDMSAVQHTRDMFSDLPSLRSIRLGKKVHITDEACFDGAGSNVGTDWMRVNLAAGGSQANPKGEVLAFSSDLCAFHADNDEQRVPVEEYVRVAPYLIITFDKASDEAYGVIMDSQMFNYKEGKALAKNLYERPGYTFSGWKDSYGNFYEDEQLINNSYRGYRPPTTFYAQWKENTDIELTHILIDEVDGTVLFSTVEKLANSKSVPEGFFAPPFSGYTFTKWVSDRDMSWSSTNPLLGEDEICRVARKNNKFLPTTFVGRYRALHYTVRFDANIPSRLPNDLLVAPPSEITVRYGKSAVIPQNRRPDVSGDYRFVGWNTQPDGTGGTYMPGAVIDNVKKDTTLYAQWEKRYDVQLMYTVDDSHAGAVSRAIDKFLFDSSTPKSVHALPLDGYVFLKWTCTENPHWSYSRAILTEKEIERAIKRNGKFPAQATFVAHFVRDTYTVTFDVNNPQTKDISCVPLGPLTVKHGEDIKIPDDYRPTCLTDTFLGWNTRAKGSGGSYLPGAVVENVRSPMVFYARWGQKPKADDTSISTIESV